MFEKKILHMTVLAAISAIAMPSFAADVTENADVTDSLNNPQDNLTINGSVLSEETSTNKTIQIDSKDLVVNAPNGFAVNASKIAKLIINAEGKAAFNSPSGLTMGYGTNFAMNVKDDITFAGKTQGTKPTYGLAAQSAQAKVDVKSTAGSIFISGQKAAISSAGKNTDISFTANGSITVDGKIVSGQIFGGTAKDGGDIKLTAQNGNILVKDQINTVSKGSVKLEAKNGNITLEDADDFAISDRGSLNQIALTAKKVAVHSKFGISLGYDADLAVTADDFVIRGYEENTKSIYGIAAEPIKSNVAINAKTVSISATNALVSRGSDIVINAVDSVYLDGLILAGAVVGHETDSNYKNHEGTIKVTATNGSIVTSDQSLIKNYGSDNVELSAKNITLDNDLENLSNGQIIANAREALVMTGDIKSHVTQGGITAKFNGQQSKLKGSISASGDKDSLAFTGGALWDVTGDSSANALTLQDSVIDLNHHKVTIGSLKGTNGTVKVDLENTDELLTVREAVDNAKLTLALTENTTADNLTGDAIQTVFKKVAGDGLSNMNLVTRAEEGLAKGATTWTQGADGKIVEQTTTNSVMQNTLDLTSGVMLSFNRILMNDTRKRMGDLRQATGDYGAWVRYDGGRLSADADLENDFNTLQVGYDMKFAGSPDWRFGVAASYTEGDADFRRGSADTKGYGLAAYGVWMPADSGAYTDLIARIAKQDNDFVIDHDLKGSMDGYAYSLSGEFGFRQPVGESFYVEPQAEVAYTFLEGDSMQMDTARYAIDDTESLVTRFGVAAGYDVTNTANLYARASVLHEFMGDTSIDSGLSVVKATGNDTWFEFAVGGNMKLGENAYVWADVERTEAANVEEDWRATVGARWNF